MKIKFTTILAISTIAISMASAQSAPATTTKKDMRHDRLEIRENELENIGKKIEMDKERLRMKREHLMNATNTNASNTVKRINAMDKREDRLNERGERNENKKSQLENTKKIMETKKSVTTADTVRNLNVITSNMDTVIAKIDARLATSTDTVKIAKLGDVKSRLVAIKIEITALGNDYANVTATSTSSKKKEFETKKNAIKKKLDLLNKDLNALLKK